MSGEHFNIRLREDYQSGGQPSAADLNRGNALINRMHGRKGIRVRLDAVEGIVVEFTGALVFSGTAYVNGVKYTGLNADATKPWVVIPLDGTAPREDEGPAPNPFPPNEEWYLKSRTAGDLHVVGTR
jgi:hypothetical protein